MKEATGELNMTVITVVAVVAVGAFFTIFVLPGLQNSIQTQTICNNGAQFQTGAEGSDGYISCSRTTTTGTNAGTFTCAYSQRTEDKTSGDISYPTKTTVCKE